MNYSPIEVATALSLYGYNVPGLERAQRLFDHFQGNCMDLGELVFILSTPMLAFAATELPFPTAEVYVQHALERYGAEAKERVDVNRIPEDLDLPHQGEHAVPDEPPRPIPPADYTVKIVGFSRSTAMLEIVVGAYAGKTLFMPVTQLASLRLQVKVEHAHLVDDTVRNMVTCL